MLIALKEMLGRIKRNLFVEFKLALVGTLDYVQEL